MPKNLLQKKDDELDKLKTAGLGATNKGIIQACQKAKRHGYIFIMHDNSRPWWKDLF